MSVLMLCFEELGCATRQRQDLCIEMVLFFLPLLLLLVVVCLLHMLECWNVEVVLLFELGIPGEALKKPSRGHPGGHVVVSIITAWQRLRFHPSGIHRQSIGNHQVYE